MLVSIYLHRPCLACTDSLVSATANFPSQLLIHDAVHSKT